RHRLQVMGGRGMGQGSRIVTYAGPVDGLSPLPARPYTRRCRPARQRLSRRDNEQRAIMRAPSELIRDWLGRRVPAEGLDWLDGQTGRLGPGGGERELTIALGL